MNNDELILNMLTEIKQNITNLEDRISNLENDVKDNKREVKKVQKNNELILDEVKRAHQIFGYWR